MSTEVDLFFTEYVGPVVVDSGFKLCCSKPNIQLFAFSTRDQINDVTGRARGRKACWVRSLSDCAFEEAAAVQVSAGTTFGHSAWLS